MSAGASALLMVIGGGTAAIAALTEDEPRIVTATGVEQAVAAPGATRPPAAAPPAGDARIGAGAPDAPGAPPVGERISGRTAEQADRTGTRPPRDDTAAPAAAAAPAPAAPAAPAPARPAVTTRTVVETRAIPYRTRLIRDPDLPRGRKRVQTAGVPGEETLRWEVTYRDGQPSDRRLVDSTVTRQPQHRVVAFGTRRGHGGDGPDRCRPSADHCFPIDRTEGCPDGTAPATESGRVSALDREFVLLTPEDLAELELDPGLLC